MDDKTSPFLKFNKEYLEAAIKALEEQQQRSALLSRCILMNTKTYDQWVKAMQEGFKPDGRFMHSYFVPENKVYNIPDPAEGSFQHLKIQFDPSVTEAFTRMEQSIAWGMSRFYGYARPTIKRKPTTWTEDNPNWSMEWDDWRNRDDYKKTWVYRHILRFILAFLRTELPPEKPLHRPVNYTVPVNY